MGRDADTGATVLTQPSRARALKWREVAGESREERRLRLWLFTAELAEGALSKQRTYVTKHGDEIVIPDPDYRAAIAAARLLADLDGLIGGEKDQQQPNGPGEVMAHADALRIVQGAG